jgi:hypothetical protein
MHTCHRTNGRTSCLTDVTPDCVARDWPRLLEEEVEQDKQANESHRFGVEVNW